MDITVLDIRVAIRQLFIPVLSQIQSELIDIAALETLEHVVAITDHAQHNAVHIVAVAEVFLVPGPPVFQTGYGNRAPPGHVFVADYIGPRGGHKTPLVALDKIVTQAVEEVPWHGS